MVFLILVLGTFIVGVTVYLDTIVPRPPIVFNE